MQGKQAITVVGLSQQPHKVKASQMKLQVWVLSHFMVASCEVGFKMQASNNFFEHCEGLDACIGNDFQQN